MTLVADMRADAEAAAAARYVAIRTRMDAIVSAASTDRISEDDLRTAHVVAGATSEDWGILNTHGAGNSKFTRQPLLNVPAGETALMQTSLNAYLSHIGLTAITW